MALWKRRAVIFKGVSIRNKLIIKNIHFLPDQKIILFDMNKLHY